MNNRLISVIVPAYNSKNTISRCMDSILCQTYKHFEIIVINDGSTDNTQKIIEYYKEKNSNIKIIQQKNRGVSVARNIGLKNATGEFIFFVDSDDEIVENAFEICINNFDNKVDSVWFKVDVRCEFDKRLEEKRNKAFNGGPIGNIYISDNILIGLLPTSWSKMYRRKNFINYDIKFPEGNCNEDEALHYTYFSIFRKAKMLNNKLYIYYINKNSIMDKITNKTEGMSVQLLWNLDFIYNFWDRHNILKGRENVFEFVAERFTKITMRRTQNFEISRCIWEITKLLRKWNIVYKSQYLKDLYDGNISIFIGGINICQTNSLKESDMLMQENSNQKKQIATLKNLAEKLLSEKEGKKIKIEKIGVCPWLV